MATMTNTMVSKTPLSMWDTLAWSGGTPQAPSTIGEIQPTTGWTSANDMDANAPLVFTGDISGQLGQTWGGKGVSAAYDPRTGIYTLDRQRDGAGKNDYESAQYRLQDGQLVRIGDWTPRTRKSTFDFVKPGLLAFGALAGGAALSALGGGAGAGAADLGAIDTALAGSGAGAVPAAADLGAIDAALAGAGAGAVPAGAAGAAAGAGGTGGGILSSLGAAGNWIKENLNLAKLGAGALLAGAVAGSAGGSADVSGINSAAGKTADLGQQALDWFRQKYDEQAGARDAAAQRANAISDAQLEAMQFANAQAKELDAYNKATFRPIEQRIASDALGYDTPERRASMRAAAAADVESAHALALEDANREMARSGIAPNMQTTTMTDLALAKARDRGAAATQAVRNVENTGYARMVDAANLGRGIPQQQATQQQIATQTGNSSVNSAATGLGATQSGQQPVAQGFNSAIQATSNAGNLYGTAARVQSGKDSDLIDGIGNLGRAVGALNLFSDEKKKKGTGKKANTARMLDQIEATQVDTGWSYDPAKGGPDDGGVKHDGPMAQRVRATMGNEVAPGGKVIDLATMNGRLMGGMQELAKRQRATEQKVDQLAARIA